MCDVELRARINPVQIASKSGVLEHHYLGFVAEPLQLLD